MSTDVLRQQWIKLPNQFQDAQIITMSLEPTISLLLRKAKPLSQGKVIVATQRDRTFFQ